MDIKKRVRDESPESDVEDSPAVKILRENLLDSLDEDPEICTSTHDLYSFMKSFEEEITASPPPAAAVASDSGESGPELGYLLEASDDELGLPPTTSSPGGEESESRTELERVESDSSQLGGEFWEIPSYDSFGFGFGETENYNGDDVAFEGMFEYSDLGFGSGDFAWRPETLPAL